MKLRCALLFPGILAANICFSQQTGFSPDNLLLPQKLIVSELVGFDTLYLQTGTVDGPAMADKPFFEISGQIKILQMLAEGVLSNKIKAYDAQTYNAFFPYSIYEKDSMLSSEEIRERLGERTDTVITQDENGNEVKLQIKYDMVLEELTSVNFIEEWIFKANPPSFDKNVIAWEPVRRYSFGDSEMEEFRHSKTFRVYNPEVNGSTNPNVKLAAQIKYEYFFNLGNIFLMDDFSSAGKGYNEKLYINMDLGLVTGNENAPFFTTFSQKMFVKSLIDIALSEKVTVREYYSQQVLTIQQVEQKIVRDEEISVLDMEGNAVVKTVKQNIKDDIMSVVFIEDWFFDAQSLRMEKKVSGIAPVRYYLDYKSSEDPLWMREILFVVNFK